MIRFPLQCWSTGVVLRLREAPAAEPRMRTSEVSPTKAAQRSAKRRSTGRSSRTLSARWC